MEIFMTLVGVLLVGYFGFMVIGKYPAVQTFLNLDKSPSNLLSSKFWVKSFKNPEVIKRFLITIGIFVVYKVLYLIPIPGVDVQGISEMMARMQQTMPEGMRAMFAPDMLKGKAHLMTIGFMPYLSSILLLQFFNLFVPSLRRKYFSDGEAGRKSIAKISLVFAVIICAVQSFFITLWLEKQSIYGVLMVPNPGWGFRMIALLSLITAFCFILWLARMITDKGVGNGFAVLIVFDMAVKFVLSVIHIAKESVGGILLVALLIPIAWLAFFMTTWQRNVPVRIKGKEASLVVRLSWLARQPISWAFSLLLLPATIASFVPTGAVQTIAGYLTRGNFLYYLMVPVLVVATAFIYKRMVFSSDFYVDLLKKYDGQVAEGSSEPELNGMVNKIVLYISLISILFTVLPDSIMIFFKVKYAVAELFSGAAIFVIVGLLYDISERMGALLQAKESGCQATCYVAFTENEAIIKKTFLEQSGISCVIDPIRFTWGMPIRTPIDEYRLNVASENVKSAQELL